MSCSGTGGAIEFWRAYPDACISEEAIRFLHQAGVNVIRIPLHREFFMPGASEVLRS